LNLFATEFNDEMLQSRVGEYRRRLKLDDPPSPATAGDHAAFVFWIVISALTYVVVVMIPLLPLLLLALWILWR